MPNSGRGHGGGRGKKHFVPLDASEWMQTRSGNSVPQNFKRPVSNNASSYYPPHTPSSPVKQQWSSVAPTQTNYQLLLNLCHSQQQLKKAGYVCDELSEEDFKARVRCLRCKARTRYRPGRLDQKEKKDQCDKDDKLTEEAEDCDTAQTRGTGDSKKQYAKSQPGCFYHPGQVFQNFWQCCSQHYLKPGCTGAIDHEYGHHSDSDFQRNWLYHRTPSYQQEEFSVGRLQLSSTSQPRLAVALDCEMGTAVGGETELIRLTVVDFFTKETLIDNIVKPEVDMWHLNTRYSGVDWKDIRNAEANGTCFYSKHAAREALWKFTGPDTIVIAHSGANDLNSLRWIHPKMVDTFVLFEDRKKQEELTRQLAEDMIEAEKLNITVEEVQEQRIAKSEADKLAKAAGVAMMEDFTGDVTGASTQRSIRPPKEKRAPGTLSLKSLVKQHANIDIQTGYGHDSLEDALACRELAIRFLQRGPHQSVDLANNQIVTSFYGLKSEPSHIAKGPVRHTTNGEPNDEIQNGEVDENLISFSD